MAFGGKIINKIVRSWCQAISINTKYKLEINKHHTWKFPLTIKQKHDTVTSRISQTRCNKLCILVFQDMI